LASNTGRKISKTSDPLTLNDLFNDIVQESFKIKMSGIIKLKILGDYQSISIDKLGYKFEKDIDKNEKEILIEFTPIESSSSNNKDYLYFQFILESDESIRVFTARIKLEKNPVYYNQNNELVHANSLRKLSNIVQIEKDLNKAKHLLDAYIDFNNKNNEKHIDIVQKTADVINQLKQNGKDGKSLILNDDQALILHNNKIIHSTDIQCNKFEPPPPPPPPPPLKSDLTSDYVNILKLFELNEQQIENITYSLDEQEKDNYNQFKIKLNEICNEFNLTHNKYRYNKIEEEKNFKLKKLLVAIEIIKQAFYLINIIKFLNNTDNGLTHSNDYFTKINENNINNNCNDIESFSNYINQSFNGLDTLTSYINSNCGSIDWKMNKVSYLKMLLKDLVDYINNNNNDNSQVDSLTEASFKLAHKSKTFLFEAILNDNYKNQLDTKNKNIKGI